MKEENGLDYNKEQIKKDLLALYKRDLLKLSLIRLELLVRNDAFVKEWIKLKKTSQKHDEKHLIEEDKLLTKWGFFYKKEQYHKSVKAWRETQRLTIEIDLRFPKTSIKKIKKAANEIIDDFKELWDFLYEEFEKTPHINLEDSDWNYENAKKELKSLPDALRGYHSADTNDYYNYIKVWDMRQEGKTWTEIQEKLNLNNLQAARDHYKVASKLIKTGLPKFTPFPQD